MFICSIIFAAMLPIGNITTCLEYEEELRMVACAGVIAVLRLLKLDTPKKQMCRFHATYEKAIMNGALRHMAVRAHRQAQRVASAFAYFRQFEPALTQSCAIVHYACPQSYSPGFLSHRFALPPLARRAVIHCRRRQRF